jgi:hypothetical protein
MRLRSANEDFEANTLHAVPGLLGKLCYVGTLHNGDGRYEHWGLTKIYGQDAAGVAIGGSHKSLISKVLKTPLSQLLDDVRSSSAGRHLNALEFIRQLRSELALLPKAPSPAAEIHFKSVLHALSALVETRNTANPRNA